MMLGKPPSNNSTVLLFSNPPNYGDLCTIGLIVSNSSRVCNSSSRNQTQILKCRELIFTEPDVIATPSFGDDRCVTLIMQKSLYKTGRLQGRFQKIGLEASQPRHVTPALFQACLIYTILAKLAPSWNKGGQWLLQGRDFLSTTACLNAIKMSLTVTSNDVNMALQAASIRTTGCKLFDLNVSPSIQQQFLLEPEGVIPETYIMNTWCHVLPSMKKGKIVSVSKAVPEDSPFQTYRDFKRHWKNTYGYRLPDSEDGMLYYQIYFKPIGQTLFTYPDLCLRSREFHFLPRVDPKPILASFLQDVAAKMATVCGQNLNFQPKAKYAKTGLCAASGNLKQSNLTSRIPRTHVAMRDPAMLQNLYQKGTPTDSGMSVNSGHGHSFPDHRLVNNPRNEKPNMHDQSLNGLPNACKILNSCGKIVPLFKSKVTPTHVNDRDNPPVKKIMPVFKPRSNPSISYNSERSRSVNDVTPLKQTLIRGETAYRVTPTVHVPENSSAGLIQNSVPVCRPLFERHMSGPSPRSRPQPQSTGIGAFVPSFLQISGNLEDEDFQLPVITTPRSDTSKPSFSSAKRKTEAVTAAGSPAVKKARSKPQIQTGVDVESLARHQQLSKVNAATLVAWLKEREIPHKAKDKKTDLVDRVNSFLRISRAEP